MAELLKNVKENKEIAKIVFRLLPELLHCLTILCLVGLPLACKSSENPAQVAVIQDTKAELSPLPQTLQLARLIDESMSKLFPHLTRHQGELLIEQNQWQFLVPGLAPPGEPSSAFRILSSVYLHQGQEWKPIKTLPLIELSLSTLAGESLQLISQSPSSSTKTPSLTTVWRSKSPDAWEASVTLRPLAKSGALAVEMQAPEGRQLLWKLRVAKGLGEDFVIPFEQDLASGLSLALLPDSMSVISASPVRIENQTAANQLSSAQASQNSGFYLLFGRQLSLQQTAMIAKAQTCIREIKDPAGHLSCLNSIERKIFPVFKVRLPFAKQGRRDRRVSHIVKVQTNTGAFRSILSIQEGELLQLSQAEGEDLEILVKDPAATSQTFRFPSTSVPLVLPKLGKAMLKLQLDEPIPAFVELRDTQHPNAISLATWITRPDEDWLSPYSVLQKNWPLQVTLPTGHYQLKVYTGSQSICSQEFTIEDGKNQNLRCYTTRAPIELSPRLTVKTNQDPLSADLMAASQLNLISMGPQHKPGLAEASDLSILEFKDHSLGFGLKAFPVDSPLREAWDTWKSAHQHPRLHDFANFIRERSSSAQLLLECPPNGFPLSEYEWLSLQLEPDILEIYGCQLSASSYSWFSVAHRLQQKLSRPLKFAAAHPSQSMFGLLGQVPAIYLPKPSPTEDTATATVENFLKGRYSVGLRTEIEILEQQGDQVKVRIRSLDTHYSALILQVSDQNGVLSHQSIPLEEVISKEMSIRLPVTSQSRWYRLALFGAVRSSRPKTEPRGSDKETSIFLLATSNFMSIDRSLSHVTPDPK